MNMQIQTQCKPNLPSVKRIVVAVAAAWGGMSCVTAAAQTAAADPPVAAAQPRTDVQRIAPVVVTAQRRKENQQDVGVSVTGVMAEQLAERNITDLSQMEQVVPGLTFGRSGSDARPAMRGVRTENVAVNGDTSIGFFVDGIYKSRAQQALASFVDVDTVEVQRGPQGTLYGRNTFGGNVAVTTMAPRLGKTESAIGLTIGNFGHARVELMTNAPIGDMWAIRFAGTYDRSDGYVKNDFDRKADLFDQNLRFGRVALRFKPDSRFEAIARVEATNQDANGGSAFGYKQGGSYFDAGSCQQLFNATATTLNVRPGNRDGVTDCTRTVGAGAGTGANAAGRSVDLGIPIHAAGDAYRIDTDYHPYVKLRDRSGSIDLSYRFDRFSVKSITGYTDFKVKRTADSDMSASTIAIDYANTAAQTFSQEFQILSEGDGPLQWIAGYYYFKDRLRGVTINQQLARTIRSEALAAPLTLAQNGNGFFDDQEPETESHAVYGQTSYKLTDALKLTLGGRYTRDRKKFRFSNGNSLLPTALSTGGALPGIQQPDTRQIAVEGPGTGTSSDFGSAGSSNCASTVVSSYNGGAALAGPGFNCGGPGNSILYGAAYEAQTFSKWTGRAAADYKITPANLVYASYSTGFRSGGFNSGQALEAVRTFKPEEVKAWELGSKNRFFDGEIQVNAAVFWNDYKNLQEQRQVPVGLATISTIFNAAKARARGLEVESEWRPTDHLDVGGTLSLLDARYRSFPDVALPFGTSILVADSTATAPTVQDGVVIAPAGQRRVFAPGYSCRRVPGTGGEGQPAAAFGCDLSGKRVPYSPRVQGSLFAGYEFFVTGIGRFQPMVVATYSSQFYGQPTNASLERQGGFVKWDLRLNFDPIRRLSTQLFVENVTNKQTINRFVWGGGGALQVSSAPPRTFGAKASYRF